MFPSSLAVIGAGLVMGGFALAAFGWAWWRGQFDRLDQRAAIILDERDLRLDRPWESELQKHERRAQFGPLLKAPAGEWGGAE